MATIKKIERKKGVVYKITVLVGTDSSGKQIRESTTYTPESTTPAKIEKEVQRFADEYEERVRGGKILSGEKMTLEAYCKMWLEEQEKRLAMGTYDYYSDFVLKKLVPALGFYKMSDIKTKHIKDFIASLKREDGQPLKPASIKKDLAVVKVIFKSAWLDEIIQSNPCERVVAPRQSKTEEKLKNFNYKQSQIFLGLLDCGLEYKYSKRTRKDRNGVEYVVKEYISKHEIPKQMKVLYCIALFAGFRRGEILGLTWDDIDFNENVISITKAVSYSKRKTKIKEPKTASSTRKVSVPVEVINLIKEYRKEWLETKLKLGNAWQGDNHLFIQANGKLMHVSTPYHSFIKLLKHYNSTVEDESMKLPIIPLHGLRHTSATLLVANKIDAPTVQKRMGHAQLSTTMNYYVHALEEVEQQAADTMENLFFKKEA